MVSKDYDNICRTERSANQLSWFRQTENWVSVCPILCGKHLLRHEWHLILYDDIVGCPSQFMGQGIVRDHEVCLFHFAVIVVSRLGIEAPTFTLVFYMNGSINISYVKKQVSCLLIG